MRKQKGQIILILLLVMTVALGIGLSIIQRSLTDISTSTKVEQSQRAFSAAEAGIERALSIGATTPFTLPPSQLQNLASVDVAVQSNLPLINQALEYPPIGKEDIAHVWLADPDTLNNYYKQTSLEVYWGKADATGREQPALEITLIYQDTASGYKSSKFYIDPVGGIEGRDGNGFKDPADAQFDGSCGNITTLTSFSTTTTDLRSFRCKVKLSGLPNSASGLPKLILVRARFLYNSLPQPLAVKPTGACTGTDTSCSLPPQARIFTSTGSSGQTQRKVSVFRLEKVVPFYFDYAIFSAGEINK